MRTILSALVTAATVAAVSASEPQGSPQELPGLLASARQALGGDAALNAIATLAISGSTSRWVGPGVTATFDTSWVAPDRFLRVSRRTLGSPIMAIDITDYDGFAGNTAIRDTVSPNAPFPVLIEPPAPTTPDAIAARAEERLRLAHEVMFEALVPLFITLPSTYGLELSAAGKTSLGKMTADVIDVKRADGKMWRLLLDEKTHLPTALTWRDKPIVTMSTSSTMTTTTRVGPGGTVGGVNGALPGAPPVLPPPTIPSGDPTAGMGDVDWVMTIGEYKLADGLNWPRRFKKTFDGREWEDTRVSRYRLNPKIDPKIFERRK